MNSYKTVFFDDEEIYRVLPHEVYHDIVGVGSPHEPLISKGLVEEVMEDIDNFPEQYGYDKEALADELQNAFGVAYEALMNDEIDFIQLTKDN